MSTEASIPPTLRLVRPGVAPTPRPGARGIAGTENAHLASEGGVAPGARFLSLVEREILPGGVVPADLRRSLLGRAGRLGVRSFDANLIIAVAQDAARRGETPRPSSATGLAEVPRERDEIVRLAFIALGVGAVMLSILIRVVTG